MYIYNSLTRKKEEFTPLKPPQVGIYTCGPTVYDEPHIGHARSAYIFEVIRKYLEYRGYKVKFVRNVTDVDDKIINKANEEFKGEDLKAAVKKVADKYLNSYHEALSNLNLDKDAKIFEPKASEYIRQMTNFINLLVEKGAAYAEAGDVYFDIAKAKEYGKLSNQSLDKMEAGARVALGENKRNPLDFALWKAAKEGEPSWKSPWGPGRPGWHIECSVMSMDILGDEFDIHGGGIDLIFPHHENEIAQAEGAGKKFARIWIHHGLLTINGQKMAKSLGNFVTIKDFLDKYKNADLLKLFFLSAHYSHPIDYSEKKIEETRQALERLSIVLDKEEKGAKAAVKSFKEIDELKDKFIAAMDDNFNTPQALAVIFDLVSIANKNAQDKDFLNSSRRIIRELLDIFGISLKAEVKLEDTIAAMIKAREEARKSKDFALSDEIRKDLEDKGIILEDTKDGKTTWRRKI
ncbi:MAG: cysteine--tRNA ligase [Candidatus Omnitrophota bacterium]